MSTEERTAEEWGRVAVSLPGWRWMPGMGLLPLPSEVERRNRDNEAVGYFRYGGHTKDGPTVTHVRPSRIRRHVNLTKGHYHPVRAFFVPDPDDPATAGCLFALLGDEVWRLVHDERGWFAFVDGLGPAGCPVVGTGHLLPCANLARAAIHIAKTLEQWPGGAA